MNALHGLEHRTIILYMSRYLILELDNDSIMNSCKMQALLKT